MKVTEEANEVIKNATMIAQSNSNVVIEYEHMLLALLESDSKLNKAIDQAKLNKLKSLLYTKISSFPKQSTQTEPTLSQELMNVFTGIKDVITVDELIKAMLTHHKAKAYELDFKEISKGMEQQKSEFAVEMVEQALKDKFNPVIGREREIRSIEEILVKKTKSNVIMTGHAGVGKTAIVSGIAQNIAFSRTPALEGYKIYNVDVGAMVAGACHRGDFEKRLKELLKEAENDPRVILFFDEIHIVLGAGKADGALDAANMLKPALADGSIKVIGATTYDEYRKHVTKDPAFARRFEQVHVREPSVEDTATILRGIKQRFEAHHGLKIADSALTAAASLGKRYIRGRRMPDLAIDLVDTACASAIITLNSEPSEIADVKNKIWSLELEKTALENDLKLDDSEKVRKSLDNVDSKILKLREELENVEKAFSKDRERVEELRMLRTRLQQEKLSLERAKAANDRYTVYDIQRNAIPFIEERIKSLEKTELITPKDIAAIISRKTGIPVSRLSQEEGQRLLTLSDRLKTKIFGQDLAIDTVSEAIIAGRVGLNDPNRPMASFMFVGPTGVGKTELSKMLCNELHGTTENMVVLDMSDFINEMSINKLIGAPAGYVGCDDGGALTEPIKEMPYTVILLDEVDLAHQRVLNVLYQLLEEGRVVDGRGVKVDFRNTVVILTTNLGSQFVSDTSYDLNAISNVLKDRFGAALFNRLDNVVVFNQLSKDALIRVFYEEIRKFNYKLKERNCEIKPSIYTAEKVIENISLSNGAREIRRIVSNEFVRPVARILISSQEENRKEIYCSHVDENENGETFGNYKFLLK